MTREQALTDAALTVQRWKRELLPRRRDIRVYIGQQLRCTPAWPVIEAKMLALVLLEGANR